MKATIIDKLNSNREGQESIKNTADLRSRSISPLKEDDDTHNILNNKMSIGEFSLLDQKQKVYDPTDVNQYEINPNRWN